MAFFLNIVVLLIIIYLLWKGIFKERYVILAGILYISLFAFYFIQDAKDYYINRYAFIETQCKIISSKMDYSSSGGRAGVNFFYRPIFTAEYSVNHQIIRKTISLTLQNFSFNNNRDAQNKIDQYVIGNVYPCWYVANDVSTVVLEKGWVRQLSGWPSFVFSLLFLLPMLLKTFLFPD
jgi:hypothetical protein